MITQLAALDGGLIAFTVVDAVVFVVLVAVVLINGR